MRPLASNEVSRMQSTAAETFFDTCQLGAKGAINWSADPGAPAYSYADAIPCGFRYSRSDEVQDGSQAPIYDAVLRLPVGTTVKGVDRVQMTHRHGSALAAPEFYAVVGKPQQGPSALVLNLKLITGNSAH